MNKKIVAPSNEVSDLVVKLRKENDRLEKKVLGLENDVLKAQNKYLELEQKYLMLQAVHKKLPPVIQTDNEELKKLMTDD